MAQLKLIHTQINLSLISESVLSGLPATYYMHWRLVL